MMYRFHIAEMTIHVEFSEPVLAHLKKHFQNTDISAEAGGQLFASIYSDGSHWFVSCATGPRPSDRRSRFFFRPDRRLEQREIWAEFEKGNHYVGDWHTHAERYPKPSSSDSKSMTEMVRKSTHQLPGFLMVIVGTIPPPIGIWISIHSTQKPEYPLQPFLTNERSEFQ